MALVDDDEPGDEASEDKLLHAAEPPVPPGLGELTAPLKRFVEFLKIDEDLIAAAAEQSLPMRDTSISKKAIKRWVSDLTVKEKDAILLQLIDGDAPNPGLELRVVWSASSARPGSPMWFVYAFVRKEAVLSAQIEGTQATLMDLLEVEASGEAPVDASSIAERGAW